MFKLDLLDLVIMFNCLMISFHNGILLFLLLTAKDKKTIFFSSHDVSKPDSGSYLSEVSNVLSLVVFLHNGRPLKGAVSPIFLCHYE